MLALAFACGSSREPAAGASEAVAEREAAPASRAAALQPEGPPHEGEPAAPREPVPPREEEEPSPELARACPDLPAARPDDLVVYLSIHEYEAPERLARWALFGAGRACPEDDMPGHLRAHYRARACVPLDAPAFDALYAALETHGLARVRTRSMPPAPHRAGSAIELAWGGRRCRVADVLNDTALHPADRDAYRAADAAVRDAIRAATP